MGKESLGQEHFPDGSQADMLEPVVMVFACSWCAYAAADLAGIGRISYPPNIRIVRVMCSGMVHPNLVLEAFRCGAGGVMVMGCHPGECHYIDGNVKAEARRSILEEMMELMELEKERLAFVWCSGTEAERFAEACREMTERIRRLGPTSVHSSGPEFDGVRENAFDYSIHGHWGGRRIEG